MIFAFMGEKGHGKSTCAKTLIPFGYPLVNFADPVKEVCKIVFGLSDEEMEDHVLKETPLDRWPYKSPRVLMQLVGTDFFRTWDDNTWVNAYKRNCATKMNIARVYAPALGIWMQPRGIVTSDIRFPNEATYVRGFDPNHGIVVKVIDPRKPMGVDTHVAERGHEQITPNFTLINDGAIADLQAQVLDIVRQFQ